MKTHIYNAELGNTQKTPVEEVLYNLSIGREVEKLFTLLRKENNSFLLASYRKNHSPIRAFCKTKMMNIDYNRLMLENEKDWKEEWERLHSLRKNGKLEFDSEETKTVFFKECRLLGIK